ILPRADGSTSAPVEGAGVPSGAGAAGSTAATDGGGDPAGAAAAGPGAPGGGASGTTGAAAAAVVTIHAAGQVSAPGVYSLPAGARVADVITAAGGLGAEADVDSLNLAAKVADGSRIYVPRKGEQVPAGGGPDGGAVGGGTGAAGGSGSPGGPGGLVDLNTATAAELDSLPGVGPATSAAILTYRGRHGRFKSVTELLEVPGIGPAKLEALRPHVTVG
ncbi:MAG: competence protein ComEA, partial [Actinomycetota bacterium]|nr:competence protein ComEA [Actinomycetota bacterium]